MRRSVPATSGKEPCRVTTALFYQRTNGSSSSNRHERHQSRMRHIALLLSTLDVSNPVITQYGQDKDLSHHQWTSCKFTPIRSSRDSTHTSHREDTQELNPWHIQGAPYHLDPVPERIPATLSTSCCDVSQPHCLTSNSVAKQLTDSFSD